MTLTPGQDRVLRAYLRAGAVVPAATCLGLAPQTVRNLLGRAYRRLGVANGLAAAAALGWLVVPD